MARAIAWIVVVVVGGCSTGPTGKRPDTGPGSASGHVETAAVAPSEQECESLLDHVIALAVRERAAGRPEQPTTDADRAAVRAEQRTGPLFAECRKLSRETYACAIAATTLAALDACQATRSSSTSNSNVAPGGMTPAAPRSP